MKRTGDRTDIRAVSNAEMEAHLDALITIMEPAVLLLDRTMTKQERSLAVNMERELRRPKKERKGPNALSPKQKNILVTLRDIVLGSEDKTLRVLRRTHEKRDEKQLNSVGHHTTCPVLYVHPGKEVERPCGKSCQCRCTDARHRTGLLRSLSETVASISLPLELRVETTLQKGKMKRRKTRCPQ